MLAASVAVAAVSVSVAVAAPVFVLPAVNVVVPHPLVDGVARVPNANNGNTNATLSPTATGAFS